MSDLSRELREQRLARAAKEFLLNCTNKGIYKGNGESLKRLIDTAATFSDQADAAEGLAEAGHELRVYVGLLLEGQDVKAALEFAANEWDEALARFRAQEGN